jgi:hypothetical protein
MTEDVLALMDEWGPEKVVCVAAAWASGATS